jgi:hypothetical protein
MNPHTQTPDIGFFDYVYIVAISVGLFPEVLGIPGLTGMLSQDWVRSGQAPSADVRFSLCLLFLGIATIALSWFGYHRSLTSRPFRYDSLLSMFRFLIDIVLLISYALLLLQFKNLKAFVFFLVLNYGLYLVWDIIKIIEFKEAKFKKRELATLLTFVSFIILWQTASELNKWLVLALATAITFTFRLSKIFISGAQPQSQP